MEGLRCGILRRLFRERREVGERGEIIAQGLREICRRVEHLSQHRYQPGGVHLRSIWLVTVRRRPQNEASVIVSFPRFPSPALICGSTLSYQRESLTAQHAL